MSASRQCLHGHRRVHSAAGRWSVAEAASAIDAHVIGDGTPIVRAASNDARCVVDGGLFVALQGAAQHGIEFARQARDAGAAAMLVGSDCPAERIQQADGVLPVIVADDDALSAIGRLARAWRRRCGWQVVGITGSTGKTSTKELLATALRGLCTVVASVANHNNELGVPLTLLSAAPDTDVVICEMGMRGRGEIGYLCDIAMPDVGVVTNVGNAHIELLGSLENISLAKAELLTSLATDGHAVVPQAQPEILAAAERTPKHIHYFASAQLCADAATRVLTAITPVDVQREASGISGRLIHPEHGAITFALPWHGLHQATNLAAVAAAFEAVGGSFTALAAVDWFHMNGATGRGRRSVLGNNVLLIDDAYNANPESMNAALVELAAVRDRRRVAIVGEMTELGLHTVPLHQTIGQRCVELGIDTVIVAGDGSGCRALADAVAASRHGAVSPQLHVFASPSALNEQIDTILAPDDVVLVKASNASGFGRIVEHLEQQVFAAPTPTAGDGQ